MFWCQQVKNRTRTKVPFFFFPEQFKFAHFLGKNELVSKKAVFFFSGSKKKNKHLKLSQSVDVNFARKKKKKKKKHRLEKKKKQLSQANLESSRNIENLAHSHIVTGFCLYWALDTNRKINLLTAKRCYQNKYRKTDFTIYYLYVLNIILGFFLRAVLCFIVSRIYFSIFFTGTTLSFWWYQVKAGPHFFYITAKIID